MKFRMFTAAVAVTFLALGSRADLTAPYIDWGQGPVTFLMTKEEAAKWKTIRSDADAKAFVDLFWARRDPTPGTPQNEYREQFDARVAWADKNLQAGESVPGSMTDRGKALILYGQPKRILRSSDARTPNLNEKQHNLQDDAGSTSAFYEWVYEDSDDARMVFGVPRATLRFVDKFGTNTYKIERGPIDLRAAQQRAIERSIKQAGLTVAPVYATAVAQATPAAATQTAAAPANVTTLTTASLQTAIDQLNAAKKDSSGKQVYPAWGEYVTSYGETFVPVMLYVPKSAGLTASQNVTFFGVVQDASGKNLVAFEQPAKLADSKGDLYVDTTLHALPAGAHRGVFGLAENGQVVALAATPMQLAGTLDKDAVAISPLIVSNNVFPLTEAQKADDPFAFGGLKVVPKADRTFRPSDELWYFFELRNPGVAELPADVVPVTGAPVPMPKIQVKLDLQGVDAAGKKVKMTAPPREIEAIEMKGVPGHFGVGGAIPLSSFKPGEYTLTVKVMDTVRKSSQVFTENFRIAE